VNVEYLPPPPVPDDASGIPTRLVFGDGIVATLGEEIRSAGVTGRAFVVADESVARAHAPAVLTSLASSGLRPELVTFPPGEASKSLESAARLFAWLGAQRAERRDCVIALGGGVAGDLGGFVAATWLRGVAFVQVPTTVLAMVDSSVGGKTAVNLPVGKNLVGAFHPPVLTLIDVQMARGLPPREVRAGWAEAIKTAAIFDPTLLGDLEGRDPTTVDSKLMARLLEAVVRWKERTVYVDPKERGIRIALNFGHTVAHAIEATAGYGTFLHGEAVAIGMVERSGTGWNVRLQRRACQFGSVPARHRSMRSLHAPASTRKWRQAGFGGCCSRRSVGSSSPTRWTRNSCKRFSKVCTYK